MCSGGGRRVPSQATGRAGSLAAAGRSLCRAGLRFKTARGRVGSAATSNPCGLGWRTAMGEEVPAAPRGARCTSGWKRLMRTARRRARRPSWRGSPSSRTCSCAPRRRLAAAGACAWRCARPRPGAKGSGAGLPVTAPRAAEPDALCPASRPLLRTRRARAPAAAAHPACPRAGPTAREPHAEQEKGLASHCARGRGPRVRAGNQTPNPILTRAHRAAGARAVCGARPAAAGRADQPPGPARSALAGGAAPWGLGYIRAFFTGRALTDCCATHRCCLQGSVSMRWTARSLL